MAEDAARRASRHVAFENVQVGAADRRLDNFHDGIRWRGDLRLRTIFNRFLSWSVIDESFHIPPAGRHFTPKMPALMRRLQRQCDALAAADAQCDDTALDPVALHRVKEPGRQHGTRRTDRMTVRDGAAFDVHDILGKA